MKRRIENALVPIPNKHLIIQAHVDSNPVTISPLSGPINAYRQIIIKPEVSELRLHCLKTRDHKLVCMINKTIPMDNQNAVACLPFPIKTDLPPGEYLLQGDCIVDGFQNISLALEFTVYDYKIIRTGLVTEIDANANSYIICTLAGVFLYSRKNGQNIGHIHFPPPGAADCCIIGEHKDRLLALSPMGYLLDYDIESRNLLRTLQIKKLSKSTAYAGIRRIDNKIFLCRLADKVYEFEWHETDSPIFKGYRDEMSSLPNPCLKTEFYRYTFTHDSYFSVEDKQGHMEEKTYPFKPDNVNFKVHPITAASPAIPPELMVLKGTKVSLYQITGKDLVKKPDSFDLPLPSSGLRLIDDSRSFYLHNSCAGVNAISNFGAIDTPKTDSEIFFNISIYCTALDHKNQLYAIGDQDGMLYLYQPKKNITESYQIHKSSPVINVDRDVKHKAANVTRISFYYHKRDVMLITGGMDSCLKLHKILFDAQGTIHGLGTIWEQEDLSGNVQDMCFVAGFETFLALTTPKTFYLIDLEQGDIVETYEFTKPHIDPLFYDVEAKRFIIGDWSGNLYFLKNQKILHQIKLCREGLFSITKIQNMLLVISENSIGYILDSQTGELIDTIRYPIAWQNRRSNDVITSSKRPSIIFPGFKPHNISSPINMYLFPVDQIRRQGKNVIFHPLLSLFQNKAQPLAI